MTTVVTPNKALTVDPLKVSQPMGAVLALLGIDRSLPLEHGAQGCTAFSKVFFTRHFREPIPLQTTAMDHSVTVMGADASVVTALATIAENHHPDLIGLVTTGLSETQGADILRTVREFRLAYPHFSEVAVVAINAPDTVGCLESGYALALEALVEELVPVGRRAGQRPQQVNVLAGSLLTPGDIEVLGEWIAAFGLTPCFLPDLGSSLDGRLTPLGFSNLTVGGSRLADIATMGEAAATLVIGPSLQRAADRLRERTGVPDYRFDGLLGLMACDRFTATLAAIAHRSVPEVIERQRAQLLDAMVDGHLQFGGARVGVAADPDLLGMWVTFLSDLGIETVAAVAAARGDGLARLPIETVTVGDLEDLETAARAAGAQLIIANSHAAEPARRLRVPLLRAGFPLYDRLGAYARRWVGYSGSRQALFDIANLLAEQRPGIAPHRSIYWNDTPRAAEWSVGAG